MELCLRSCRKLELVFIRDDHGSSIATMSSLDEMGVDAEESESIIVVRVLKFY